MNVTIYHNPNCSTSRNALEVIRESGIEPTIVEYLKTPPSRAELTAIVKRMGVPLRAILRKRGTNFEELGLDDPKWTDAQILDEIEKNPVLIERPIVVSDKGAVLCRPLERVREVLP